jgi:hypothetical protein
VCISEKFVHQDSEIQNIQVFNTMLYDIPLLFYNKTELWCNNGLKYQESGLSLDLQERNSIRPVLQQS